MEGRSQTHSTDTNKTVGRWLRGKTSLPERLASFFRLPLHTALERLSFKLKYPLYSSPLYRWLLQGKSVPNLNYTPTDPWLGDPAKGRDILNGKIELAGQTITNPAPRWATLGGQ
jgi:hypothetical protein